VTTVAIGDKLHQKWAISFDDPIASELDGMPGCDDVHTVDLCVCVIASMMWYGGLTNGTDLDTRDLVTTGKVLGVGGTALGRCAHTVLVVLANENAREVP